MIQLFHQRLGFQEIDNRIGVTLRHFHTWRERAQAAQQQIAVERAAGDADIIRPPCQFCDGIRIFSNHHARHHVGMAVEVFGAGVQHQIGAQRQRVLQRRA